jgi:hypothetical protein
MALRVQAIAGDPLHIGMRPGVAASVERRDLPATRDGVLHHRATDERGPSEYEQAHDALDNSATQGLPVADLAAPRTPPATAKSLGPISDAATQVVSH